MKDEILSCLSPQYPWGELVTYLPETDSTNTQLKRLAREGAPEGTALVSGHQTVGRGRKGRSFYSPEGMGIYLSILLRPKCEAADLMHLTCATGVAMCNAMESITGVRPGIKWTNDLVFGKRKLGGILTELGFTPQGKLDYAVIGIGINCRQQPQDFPPEIRDMAGSLAMMSGQAVSRAQVAAAMLDSLYQMRQTLLTGKDAMFTKYRRDCVTLGQPVSLVRGEEVRHAYALTVDNSGALVVRLPDGQEETVNSGEVSVRGMYGYV